VYAKSNGAPSAGSAGSSSPTWASTTRTVSRPSTATVARARATVAEVKSTPVTRPPIPPSPRRCRAVAANPRHCRRACSAGRTARPCRSSIKVIQVRIGKSRITRPLAGLDQACSAGDLQGMVPPAVLQQAISAEYWRLVRAARCYWSPPGSAAGRREPHCEHRWT
jgi:hypothetical protein